MVKDVSRVTNYPAGWPVGQGRDSLPKQSVIRVTISGTDIQYPAGTSLRKTVRGVNFGNYGTVTTANAATIAAQVQSDGIKIVRLVSNIRWFGQYSVTGTDSRDDTCFANFDAKNWLTLTTIVKSLTSLSIWVILTLDSDCAINGGTQSTGEEAYCEALVKPGETPMILNSDGSWTTVGGTWSAAGGYNAMTSPVLFAMVRAIWKMLVLEFRSYDYIYAYELGSEILGASGTFTYNGSQWAGAKTAYYTTLINDIRPLDSITPFVVGGTGYATNALASSILAGRTDVIYAFNLLSGILINLANLPGKFDTVMASNVPLLSDQMGSQSSDDPNDYALHAAWSIANARGVITTWWNSYDKGLTANGYGWRYSDGAGGFIDKQPRLASSQYFMTQTLAALETAAKNAATAESAVLFYIKPDFSNAFQDSAGTTPVTAAGQPLGLLNPVIGSGLTLTQSTSGNRPTVGAAATSYLIDQRPVISFDGSTGWLNGSVAFFSSGSQMTVIAAGIPSSAATTQDFVMAGNSTSTVKWPRLQASSANVAACVWQSDTTTNTVTGTTGTASFPIVVSCTRDASANKKLYSNGVQDSTTNSTADGTIATFTRLRVGGSTTNTATFAGPIALVCFKVGTMSDANRQAIERFGAYLVGAGYQL